MHSSTRRRSRWRVAAPAAAVTAGLILSSCGVLGGASEESSSPDYEPVKTTTTSEPSTAAPTSTGGDPPPSLPKGDELLARAKKHMGVMSSVTIDGTVYLDEKRTTEAKLHSEGSTGGVLTQEDHAGSSSTTLTLGNGGTLEARAVGWHHYLKVDEKWVEGSPSSRALARHAGRWLKFPRDDSPVDALRPNRVIKERFFGDALTPFDGNTASTTAERLDGEWVYRLDLVKAGEGQQAPRTMWVSAAADAPEMLKLTYGPEPKRDTYTFSKWDSTAETVEAPTGAKTLADDRIDDIL